MLTQETPDTAHVLSLMDRRAEPLVTIALESSPIPADHERIRIAFRDAVDEAASQLEAGAADGDAARRVFDALRGLQDDDEFWGAQSHGLIVLASPDVVEAFRLPTEPRRVVAVGDRFHTSPLLLASTTTERIFVLKFAQGSAELAEITPQGTVVEHALDLPDDHELLLERADNDGGFDLPRAQGASGDRIERERYARVVEEKVARVVPAGARFVLAASRDLDPAYRAVNTVPTLLDASIDAHPQSLDDRDLVERARRVVDGVHDREVAAWKERFGTLRAQGLATSRIAEVAAAAAEAAIDELRFDRDTDATGAVDEFGRVDRHDDSAPLVDEIAARVLHSGGTVRGVDRADLVDGSPVAATLRFPVSNVN